MKRIEAILVIVLATLAVLFVATQPASAAPKAKAAQSGCTSNTFLHVECATHIALSWVNYDCCSSAARRSYDRRNANRVDIYVRAWHPGRGSWSCRWVIVRGHDFSKYAYYHPDSHWHNC